LDFTFNGYYPILLPVGQHDSKLKAKQMIRLTKAEVMHFSPETYKSVATVQQAIQSKYACGIDAFVAQRIINDYNSNRRN
jgi:hypothetical protein